MKDAQRLGPNPGDAPGVARSIDADPIAQPRTRKSALVWLAWSAFAVLGIGQTLILTAHGYPCPRGDDAVYKSPAAEWAMHGTLRIPAMTGALRQASSGFAHYPPIYQICFAFWYAAWGFSLTSTLLLSHLIHVACATAIGFLTRSILRELWPGDVRMSNLLGAGAASIHLGNLSFFDRPEELGMIFLFAATHLISRHSGKLAVDAGAGLLIAAAGLTAPWCGVMAGLIVVSYQLISVRWTSLIAVQFVLLRIAWTTVVALLPVAVWWVGMEWLHPGIVTDQLLDGNMMYASQGTRVSIMEKIRSYLGAVEFDPPRLLVYVVVGLAPFVWRERSPVRGEVALGGVAFVASIGLLFVRPTAYTYVGAVTMLLVPLFSTTMSRFICGAGERSKIGIFITLACLALAQRDGARYMFAAMTARESDSFAVNRDELTQLIPAGDLVGVSPRHWYAFQGRNPWRELFFVGTRGSDEILNCKWLVSDPGTGIPPFLDTYEVAASKKPIQSAGMTYTYLVWRKKDADANE